jgi:hypothetical protein
VFFHPFWIYQQPFLSYFTYIIKSASAAAATSSSSLNLTTPVASVVHIGSPNAFVSQSSSLGPWILDSGASDHMSGNKLLFSHLTFMDSLANVTLAK